MSSRLPLTLLISFICFIAGGSIFIYKLYNGFPLLPEEKVSSWHLELSLKLQKSSNNLQLRVALPTESDDLKIIDSHVTDNNFGDYIDQDHNGPYIVWSKKSPQNTENLYYRAVIYKVKSADTSINYAVEKPILSPISLKLNNDASLLALNNIREKLSAQSASDFNFITGLQRLVREGTDSDLRYIQAKLSGADKVTICAEILNFSGIPAQIVNGVLLSSAKRNVKIIRWVNAFTEHKKISFSPYRQTIGMPSNILPWWQGDKGMLTLQNSKSNITRDISVKRHTESALTEAIWTGNKIKESLYQMTIYALPVDIQVVMRILLLIPFGALICILLKQVIGIQTLGTFMPVLLAMAFKETSFLSGLIVFATLIGIGIIFRNIFDKMQLLNVPRLGAILTIIVLCVFLISLLIQKFGFQVSGLSLFPLVIITMMVERIYVTWDEMGGYETMMLTLCTLCVSAMCYVAIILPAIEHIFITFPELLLVVVGLMLLIGRYNGYKLTEYYRFKAMHQ